MIISRRIGRLSTTLLAVLLFLVAGIGSAAAEDEWIVRESSRSVSKTVERLTTAIERSGGKVVAVVDHSANAEAAGLELAPTTVVLFANPRLGTPAIAARRQIAIDLPLRMLVWEEEGVTRLGYPSIATLAHRYDLALDDRKLSRMGDALASLASAALNRSEDVEAR